MPRCCRNMQAERVTTIKHVISVFSVFAAMLLGMAAFAQDDSKPTPPIPIVVFDSAASYGDDVPKIVVQSRDALRDDKRLEVLLFSPDSPTFIVGAKSANPPLSIDDIQTASDELSLTNAVDAQFYLVVTPSSNNKKVTITIISATTGVQDSTSGPEKPADATNEAASMIENWSTAHPDVPATASTAPTAIVTATMPTPIAIAEPSISPVQTPPPVVPPAPDVKEPLTQLPPTFISPPTIVLPSAPAQVVATISPASSEQTSISSPVLSVGQSVVTTSPTLESSSSSAESDTDATPESPQTRVSSIAVQSQQAEAAKPVSVTVATESAPVGTPPLTPTPPPVQEASTPSISASTASVSQPVPPSSEVTVAPVPLLASPPSPAVAVTLAQPPSSPPSPTVVSTPMPLPPNPTVALAPAPLLASPPSPMVVVTLAQPPPSPPGPTVVATQMPLPSNPAVELTPAPSNDTPMVNQPAVPITSSTIDSSPAITITNVSVSGSSSDSITSGPMVSRTIQSAPILGTTISDAAQAYIDQGDAALQTSDNFTAIADYQKAVSLSPRAASPRLKLANAYLEAGMKERASDEAQRALAIDPGNTDVQSFIRDQVSGQDGPSGDVMIAQAQTESDPNNPASWISLGDAYWNISDPDDSLISYKHAADIDPDAVIPQTRLAKLYAARAQYDLSLAALDRSGPAGYPYALRIISSQSVGIVGDMDDEVDQLNKGQYTREQFYDKVKATDLQAENLADFVAEIRPPEAYKVSHLHRELSTRLIAQTASIWLDYAQTNNSSDKDNAAAMEKHALDEVTTASIAEDIQSHMKP
jgi:tetratricopeptide (TPR) repeat protein